MKKAVIKGAVIGIVFFTALFLISHLANEGNNDLTVEMAEATYPLVYMEKEGILYNCLHGYGKVMNTGFERDTITVLDESRSTGVVIETFDNTIVDIGFEVRSVDGSRLIEDGTVTDYEEKNGKIRFTVALKDLIDPDTDYCLVLLLTMENQNVIRYYTRVVWAEDYETVRKLDFVRDFCTKTFQKAGAKELTKYLESNSEGDNSTFYKVDIHSSFKQVTWGDMEVSMVTEPVPDIIDITKQTASIKQTYYVVTGSDKNKLFHRVEEYYRIRYTKERTYLLDFERKMEQILSERDVPFENNKLNLGIISPDFDVLESEDGNILVFENGGRLFSYNVTDNKLSVLFAFYNAENRDQRVLYQKHRIRVLNVDEAGNIQFVVYGYMNRGHHEGDVGIQVYYYNSSLNTIEEAVYIPYDKSADVLLCEMENLLYMNRNNQLFFMLEGSVYGVDLEGKTYEILAEDMSDGSVQVSANGKMVVWQKSQDIYSCRELLLTDLSSRRQIEIGTQDGDYILPLGFIDEDLIYGLAHPSDITEDNAGKIIFPMYAVYIQNVDGEILKEYRQDGIYVTDCVISKNQISMSRVTREENGDYTAISDDQIMSSEAAEVGKNTVEVINAGIYEKQVQIVFKETVDKKGLKVLTPKEVLFEGGRELTLTEPESKKTRYYAYGPDGVEGIYMNPANAVNLAYECSGVVTDAAGKYIFRKGNRVIRNQIMAITGNMVDEERSSVSVCLDTILELEGVVRNTQLQLNQGEGPYEILQESLSDYQVLDLTGCTLDAVLYYVDQDLPVMVVLSDGNAVLITGFNELNIVIMDPLTGNLYKKGIKDSTEWFNQNGNCFITYVK